MRDETTAVEVRVTGRVQGVGFRAWTRAEALRRSLTGWVRNEADGSVGAFLQGPEAAVSDMVAALENGPVAARVDGVTVGNAVPNDLPDFSIRPTL